ncbi:MAG: sulfatase-like hydrolase/transferase [Verrucomicrobiota bacterium]
MGGNIFNFVKILIPRGKLTLSFFYGTISILSLLTLSSTLQANKPNLLLIVTDDQGYGDLSLHGNTVLDTPHLDKLGQESMRFESFHTTPVCATTRASLLTGKNHLKVGVWGVHISRDYLHLRENTLAQILKDTGYATGFIGKWHCGRAPAWMPWNRGFDEAWVADLYNHYETPISYNGRALKTKGWADESFTNLAIDFIKKQKQPFFLMLNYMSIHTPLEAPETSIQKHRDKGQSEYFSTLNGMIEYLDFNIGRLVHSLETSGLRKDTVIVFISDNGPIHKTKSNKHRLTREEIRLRCPQKYKGVKGNIWQNALRVPCFISWPGKIDPGSIDAFTDVTDLFPTLLDLANAKLPQNGETIDGLSLNPFLQGQQTSWPEKRDFYRPHWTISLSGSMQKNNVLVSKNTLKFDTQIGAWRHGPYKFVKVKKEYSLYDISKDPSEKTNIMSDHPELADKMKAQLKMAFEDVVQHPRSFIHPRFHIGHPVYDTYDQVGGNLSGSQIPCGGGIQMSGNVKADIHSSLNWKESGDSQTIPVEVITGGEYEVRIDAPGSCQGTKLMVTVGDSILKGTLKQAGTEWKLGTLKLKEGAQDLTIHLIQKSKDFSILRMINFIKQ